MFRVVLLVLFLSVAAIGQTETPVSVATRTFLQTVAKGELAAAETQTYKLLIADGKVFGSEEAQPTSAALKVLHDSGYEYHKELSVETSKDLSRVYVEMILKKRGHTAVDLYEILLIRSGTEWKVSGWRNVSTPIDRSRHLTVPNEKPVIRPFLRPSAKPCPTCT